VHSTPEAETLSNINEKKISRSFLGRFSKQAPNNPSWAVCLLPIRVECDISIVGIIRKAGIMRCPLIGSRQDHSHGGWLGAWV